MADGFRAKWFIPCPRNRCYVVKDGREIKSRMQLIIRREDGMFLEEPYYRCEQEQCEHHRYGIPAVRIDKWWIMDGNKKRFYKSDDARTREEMEVCL